MAPPEVRFGEMLGALSFASDLAFGLEFEDGARSCYFAISIADRLGLNRELRADVYYTALLKDAGCTCWTSALADTWVTDEITARRELLVFGNLRSPAFLMRWMWQHVGSDLPLPARLLHLAGVAAGSGGFVREGFRSSCEVAARISARLGMSATVQNALESIFEQWDGKGFPDGLRGDKIPLVSRIVLPTFFLAPVYRASGRALAVELARDGRGSLFDPNVVDAFLQLSTDESFWRGVDEPGLWRRVIDSEPGSPSALDENQLDTWTEVFADFIDLKVPHMSAHSRRVAELAARIAERLGCCADDVHTIRRAGLSHDLGLVAVPSYTLQKPEDRRATGEREQIRLHPYTAGRVLSLVPGLAPVAGIIQAHHEHMDGSGFPQGTKGNQIPLGARIIAVADRFDDLTHDGPDSSAIEPGEALDTMFAQSGRAFAREPLEALREELQFTRRTRPAVWPSELTDREVEVLRCASLGFTRRQIAEELVISEHTVRHHLSHIYDKVGVTTRVAATLWAIENGLFSVNDK